MKRNFSVILSLIMLLGILPFGCLEVFAADTGNVVYVNGKKMTGSVTSLKCGDGYAYFDAATNTLRLENCTIKKCAASEIDGTAVYAAIIGEADLTVELEGINRLIVSEHCKSETINAAIYSDGDLAFCGNGKLFVAYGTYLKNSCEAYSVFAGGTVTFSEARIIVNSNSAYGVKCNELKYVGDTSNPYQSFFISAVSDYLASFLCRVDEVLNCEVFKYHDSDTGGSFFSAFPGFEASKENPWRVYTAEELTFLLCAPTDMPMYLQLANDISSNMWDTVDVRGTKTVDLNGFDIYGHLPHTSEKNGYGNKLEYTLGSSSKNMFRIQKFSHLTVEDSTGNNGEVFYDCYIPDLDDDYSGILADGVGLHAFYLSHNGFELGSTRRNLFSLAGEGSELTINSGIFKAGRKKEQYFARKAKYADALFLGCIVHGEGAFTSNGAIYTFNAANAFKSTDENNKIIINDGIFTCKSHDSRGLFFNYVGYEIADRTESDYNHITLNGGKFVSEKLGTNDPNGATNHNEAELHIGEEYFDFQDNADYFYNGRQITEYTDDLLNKRGTFEIKPKINGELRISAPDNAEKYNNEYYYAQNSSFVITPTAFPKFYTDGFCSELEHTYYEYTVTDAENPALTYTTNTAAATFDLGSISPSQFTFEKGHTYSVKCTYGDYYHGTCRFDLAKESENEILIHISGATLPTVTGHSVAATFYRSSSTDTKRGMATLTVSDCGEFDGGSCELLFYPKSTSYESISQPITGDGKYTFNFISDANGLETYAYEIKMYDKNGYPTFSSRETFKGATGPWIYISTSGYSKPLVDGQRYVMAGSSVTLKTEPTLNGVTYQWYKLARNTDGSYAASSETVSGGTSNTLTVTAPGKYYLRIFTGSYYAYSNTITVDTPQTTSDLCVTLSSSADSCSKTSPATLTATPYNVNTSKSVMYEWTITKAPDGFGYTRPYSYGSGYGITTRPFPSSSADLSAYPPGIYEFTCKITNDGKSYTAVPVKVQLTKTVERIETYYNDICFADGDTLYMPSQEKSITVFSASYPREITSGYNISYKVSEGNSVKITDFGDSCAVIAPVHPGTSKIKVYIKDQDGSELYTASTITVVVPVSVVDVYINQPMVKGGTLEQSDITVDDTYFSSVVKNWFTSRGVSALDDGYVIEANKRYTATVNLTLKSGYYLPTKNPKTDTPQFDASGNTKCIKIRWHTDPDNLSKYTERLCDCPSSGIADHISEMFDFDTVKDKTCAYFDDVECRFFSPDAGTAANAFGSCFIFGSSNFRQSAAVIIDETAGGVLVEGSTAFIEGHTYSAILWFETTVDDLYFDDSPAVTINGQPFGAHISDNSLTPDTIELTEHLTFTCGVKEYDYIDDVSLSGVETPVAGAEAPLLNNVTDNGTISVDTDKLYVTKVEWYSNGNDWNDFLDGRYFKQNTAYKARIWVEVNTDDYPTYRLYKVNSTPWLKVDGQSYDFVTSFVNGAQTKGYVDVNFPATGGIEGISVAGSSERTWQYKEGCFTAAEAAASAYTVTVINHTANTFTNLSVNFTGGDADCFTVNQPAKGTLGAYESTSFTVVPKHDLTGGVYRARYQLSYDSGEPTDFVFTVSVEERDWNYLSGLMYLDVENKNDYDYMKLITVTLTPQSETEPVITQSFVGFDAQPYSISNITPGIYTLRAEHEGSVTYEQTVDITTDAEHNIYMPLAESGESGSLFGYVSYSSFDGAPVLLNITPVDDWVTLTREFTEGNGKYGYINGRYSLAYSVPGIENGDYRVEITKSACVSRNVLVSVNGDTAVSTSLNLQNDVNGSGGVDIADYALCVNLALGTDNAVNADQTADGEYRKRVADIDGDGFIDVLDCALLERALYY